MATATIRSGGNGHCFYNINGGSWRAPYNNQIMVGVGDGSTYRAYFELDLSSINSSATLNSDPTLKMFNTTDYVGTAYLAVGIRTSAPGATFSTSDFAATISSSWATSYTGSYASITVAKATLQPYLGQKIYICIVKATSANNYAELGANSGSNDPYIELDYTFQKSTLSATGNTIGSAVSLNITRYSSSYTHTITYSAGGQSGTITTKTNQTTVSWTPPMAICGGNTSGTTVSCTFTLTTYNGSTTIGTSTLAVTLNIPSSVVPTIASGAAALSATSDNATVAGWGVFLAGYSKLRVTWDTSKVSGAYGSTVSSYQATVSGTTYTGTTVTSGVLSTSGSYTIGLKVTDSRGRSTTTSKDITVQAYNSPYISTWNAFRANSGGTATDGGAYIRIKATLIKTNVGSNTGTITVKWKKASDATYANSQTISSGDTYTTINAGMEEATTYNVMVIPSDSLRTGASLSTVLNAKREDIVLTHNGNLAVGIGKSPENSYEIDMALFARFRNWAYHHGTAVWLDQDSVNRLYIQGDGKIYAYDSSSKQRMYVDNGSISGKDSSSTQRYYLDSSTGNIRNYDSSGQERVGLYPAEGQLSLYNSSGTRTVQIRGDGTASSNPLPVSQGGTGETTVFPKHRHVSGSVAAVYNDYVDVVSTSLPGNYNYIILATLDVNASISVMGGRFQNVTVSRAVRTTGNSGGGAAIWAYLSSSTTQNVTLQGYGYVNGTYNYRADMDIWQFPALSTSF